MGNNSGFYREKPENFEDSDKNQMGNEKTHGGFGWTQGPAEMKMYGNEAETEQFSPDLPEIVVGNIAKIL